MYWDIQLNNKIIKHKYPLPEIYEVLDKFGDDEVFAALDLKIAFFHVVIDEKGRKDTDTH